MGELKKGTASMMNAVHDLPLLVARDDGFFRDEGLDVTILKTPGTGQHGSDHQALRDNIFSRTMEKLYDEGECDQFRMCEWGIMKRAVESQAGDGHRPAKIVALGSAMSTFAIVTDPKAGIYEPEQLKGKPIGVSPFNGSHFTTLKLLEGFLKREQIKTTFAGTMRERIEALKRGEVAAVSVMEPWISVAEKQGLRVLMESHSTRSEAASDELDGQTLRKMFEAEAEAARAIDKNPAKYAHYLVAEAGGMLELEDLKLTRILNAPPEQYTRERFDHTYQVRVGSSAIPLEQWLTLSRRINEIFAREPEVKGVVVTHGSNTVEETAYFLSLTVGSDKPVVLTAAQRQFSTLSSDSPKNFLQAVRVAAADEARGKGALVVTNDVINAARDVSKNISYRVETYSSRDIGALGFVDEDRVTFYRAPTRHPAPFDVTRLQKLPRVDVIYTYAGADGALMEAAIAQARAEGLVIAGFPTGSGTPAMDEVTKRFAARGIP